MFLRSFRCGYYSKDLHFYILETIEFICASAACQKHSRALGWLADLHRLCGPWPARDPSSQNSCFSPRSCLGPGGGGARAASGCGDSLLRLTLSPLLHPGSATLGGAVFLTTREAVLAKPGITGPPFFGERWHLRPPDPRHCAEALVGSKDAGSPR